jgi:hypothetical protein
MRVLLIIQSVYFLLTALWPLLDIESFMAVTGPKTDIWLVKTVAALLIPVSICIALPLLVKMDPVPSAVLAFTSNVSFICIDVFYSLNGTISKIYLADAVIQLILFALWMAVLAASKRRPAVPFRT